MTTDTSLFSNRTSDRRLQTLDQRFQTLNHRLQSSDLRLPMGAGSGQMQKDRDTAVNRLMESEKQKGRCLNFYPRN